MKSIFITGTDTGVGKTYTVLRLIEAAHKLGIKTAVMKPFETGCRLCGRKLVPTDAINIMKASDLKDINMVNQYRFKAPAAPYIAAQLEHKVINPAKVFDTYEKLSKQYEFIIMEGAGGLLVPITKDFSYADLAKKLSLPVLIVSANKLGAINHTMLTMDCLNLHDIEPLAVILNNTDKKSDIARKTNAKAFSKLLGKRFLGEMVYGDYNYNAALCGKIIKRI